MARVDIIRHKPGAVFCGTCEVVITDDAHNVLRLVEPSAGEIWFEFAKANIYPDLGSLHFIARACTERRRSVSKGPMPRAGLRLTSHISREGSP